jgi:hypothetical protein
VYVWAVVGIFVVLAQGLIKLVPVAGQAVLGPLSTAEHVTLWLFVAVNLYLEGYRGFQLRFVPRVISRALHLSRDPQANVWSLVLAPLFSMGFFHATRRARLSAWIVSGLIVLAVLAVRHLPHPWRGIIDAGVVAGLGYGTLVFVQQAITSGITGIPRVSAELPGGAQPSAPAMNTAPGSETG